MSKGCSFPGGKGHRFHSIVHTITLRHEKSNLFVLTVKNSDFDLHFTVTYLAGHVCKCIPLLPRSIVSGHPNSLLMQGTLIFKQRRSCSGPLHEWNRWPQLSLRQVTMGQETGSSSPRDFLNFLTLLHCKKFMHLSQWLEWKSRPDSIFGRANPNSNYFLHVTPNIMWSWLRIVKHDCRWLSMFPNYRCNWTWHESQVPTSHDPAHCLPSCHAELQLNIISQIR